MGITFESIFHFCFCPFSLTMAVVTARAISCELQPQKSVVPKREPVVVKKGSEVVPKLKLADFSLSSDNTKNIVLQPRLCTLRSYGSDREGRLIKTRRNDGDQVPTFFSSLSEYIDNSRKSQDFETVSGRLAMVVFAATVTMEIVTGDTLFQKMDLQRIAQVAGVCLSSVVFAAAFAWFSSARTKVGRVFTVKCNTFIDSLIDDLVDGLFFEAEISDWTDEM